MSLKPKRVNFEDTWEKLSQTAVKVVSGKHVERSDWSDRFSDVYALCVAHPEPLGDRLFAETKTFFELHVGQKLKELNETGDENLLNNYYSAWQEFNQGASDLNKLFGYLNTQFIKKQKVSEADMNYGGFTIDSNEHLLEIGELGLDIWKRQLVQPIKDSLVSLLLQQIDLDRHNSMMMNPIVVQGIILSFVEIEKFKAKAPLKFYEELFEEKLLQQTSDFYHREAMMCMDRYDCHDYMVKVLQYMSDENMRAKKFLNGSSFEKVVRVYQQKLVADNLQFLHQECRNLVQKEIREDLTNMYRLLHPINIGLGVLVTEVENHIKLTSLDTVQAIQGENMSQQFVESMLAIHAKYSELVQNVFSSDQQFTAALDKACTAAINYRANPRAASRAPELLAKYIDSLLKRTVKGTTETETDDKLNNSITIFKYLDDKDVFNRFYAKLLTKRLIYGLSQSMDAEESLINRLKQACGYEFTSKLHKMFSDMNINVDLNNKFAASLKDDGTSVDLGVSFSILVLQAGAWPITQGNLPTFALPQELERSVHTFEQYYAKHYNGRKLTWIHAFCLCEVKMNYQKRTYYATMGTFLVGVLIQFNSSEQLTFKELLECTLLPSKELVRHAQLLVDAKLLTADEATVTENTTFILNLSYNNKRTKFKIMLPQKDTVQETEQTFAAVDEDRKLFLQAAVVRIMKSRKLLKHNLLIQEVLSQSQGRFAPSISHIKKCIETLIDKQYIERTGSSSDEYSYIA